MNQAAHGVPHTPTGVDGWAEHAFDQLAALPGVVRVGLALVEGGGRRLQFTATERLTGPDLGWCLVDAYDDVPLNTAVRRSAPVMGAIADLDDRFARFVEAQRDTSYVAVAAVPITATRDTLGGFVLFFDRAQPFDRHQRAELSGLGRVLGAGLRRAQLARRRTAGAAGEAAPPGARVAVHEVDAELEAVGNARAFLRRTLADWGFGLEHVDTATLCLSELVTNAVIHSHGGCVVRVVLHDRLLTVWVRDSGIAGAVPLEPAGDPLEVHGRGLQLVEALATAWGHDQDAEGASVWFALEVA